MSRIKLYIRKIKGFMKDQGVCGKISFLRILLDIAWCNILYGATISDYFYFRFYQKTAFHRKEFMTAKDKNRFYTVMNDQKARMGIQNKDAFNETFAQYTKRDSVNTPQCGKATFCKFFEEHKTIFIKPIATGGGDGIEKLVWDPKDNAEELYDRICQKGACVVEAGIEQHPIMTALHPQSVNSIRIATVFDGERVHIVFAQLRCGTGTSFVDNHNAGGICMLVDKEEGKVCSLASGRKYLNLVKHPDTGVFLPGFQIPYWDKCLNLINEVARKTGNVRYVGWDIAITPDDVCLIEANPGGDFNIYQESTQTGCKKEAEYYISLVENKKQ